MALRGMELQFFKRGKVMYKTLMSLLGLNWRRFHTSTGSAFCMFSFVFHCNHPIWGFNAKLRQAWQHHVRILNDSSTNAVLSIFDNANAEPPLSGVNQTLGLLFSLDLESKSATLLQEYKDANQPLFVDSQGALSILANGNALQGYGQIPIVKEYGPEGDVRMSVQFGDLDGQHQSSYRVYRLEWEAVPAADPALFAEQGHAYASWNGATQVYEWDIFQGTTAESVVYTHSVKKFGFETELAIFNTTKFVKVAAVYDAGKKRDSAVVAVA